jgi:hypothetical protein
VPRYITVYKNEGSSIVAEDAVLNLSQDTLQILSALLAKYPVRYTWEPVLRIRRNILRIRIRESLILIYGSGSGYYLDIFVIRIRNTDENYQ